MKEMLSQYVATLGTEFVKLHNLHWNVIGRAFKVIHEFTEEMYEDRAEKFDAVAELMKMKGLVPPASLKKYVELSVIKEVEEKEYCADEVLKILLDDAKAVRDLIVKIREQADAADDFATVAMMEDHAGARSKEIWFLESMLKCDR